MIAITSAVGLNPNGIRIIQPSVAAPQLRWVNHPTIFFNPEGDLCKRSVAAFGRKPNHSIVKGLRRSAETPLRQMTGFAEVSEGVASLFRAPGCNPFRVDYIFVRSPGVARLHRPTPG